MVSAVEDTMTEGEHLLSYWLCRLEHTCICVHVRQCLYVSQLLWRHYIDDTCMDLQITSYHKFNTKRYNEANLIDKQTSVSRDLYIAGSHSYVLFKW